MEGLNDGRALKTIVPQVNPRKLVCKGNVLESSPSHTLLRLQIIVHASREASENLVESCGAIRAMTRDIYAPALGDTCQIGQHTNSFSISLSDELLASIKMSSVSNHSRLYEGERRLMVDWN
jgi:cleavage and polyadenylation specificity factor subunit 2